MVVGGFIDLTANRKLRIENSPQELMLIISRDWISALYSKKLNEMDIVSRS